MRALVTNVYTYDELSEQAQSRARDWYRECMDTSDYADTVIEDACLVADTLGITFSTRPVKLYGGGTRHEPRIYWLLYEQGAGASFEGSYSYTNGALAKLLKNYPAEHELHRIARILQDVQRRNFYQLEATVSVRGTSTHEGAMNVDVERRDGGIERDEDTNTVTEALRDFASWIHSRLLAEHKYQASDEVVADNILANEYEFAEDGRWAV